MRQYLVIADNGMPQYETGMYKPLAVLSSTKDAYDFIRSHAIKNNGSWEYSIYYFLSGVRQMDYVECISGSDALEDDWRDLFNTYDPKPFSGEEG